MKTIKMAVENPECEGNVCPMPLEILSNVEKDIKKVKYDVKTEQAEITFDEKKVTEQQIRDILSKRGYKVKEKK